MTQTQTRTNRIILPDADDLDTGAWTATSGYQVALYLVPAEETETDSPEVVIHSGVGNIGWPMPGFHGRWQRIASYGPQISGEGVRAALEAAADSLLALAGCYEGTRWDGSNHRGQWSQDAEEYLGPDLIDLDECPRYWDAGDWLIGESWESLCRDSGVECDADDAVDKVVEDCLTTAEGEALLDESDLREYLSDKRADWIAEDE